MNMPPYIFNTLAPDPHPTRHMFQGIAVLVLLIVCMIIGAVALLVISPFLLVAWICGGFPDRDGVPIGVPPRV